MATSPRTNESGVPTLEQLENTAVALGFPILVEGLRPSYYEDSLRNLHAIVQKAALGDEEATTQLQALRRAFADDRT